MKHFPATSRARVFGPRQGWEPVENCDGDLNDGRTYGTMYVLEICNIYIYIVRYNV